MRAWLAALVVALAAAAPALAQDRPLVIVLPTQPETVDPLTTIGMPAERPPIENVCETVIGVDHDGRLTPTLATWSVAEDGKEVTLKLRPGVKFHSGNPMTADDLIWSNARGLAKSANYRNYMRGFDHAEKVDGLTVRFVYTTPNIGLLTSRNLFIEGMAHAEQVGEDEARAHPDCTGPYTISELRQGQYIDLTAFDGYWGGRPAIRAARFAFVADDQTRVAMLRTGEADIDAFTPWTELDHLRQAGFGIVRLQAFPTAAINFDMYDPTTPWMNLKVRQAIAHAIDSEAIIKGLLQGVPDHFAMLAPGEVGYDPGLKPYAYDPKLARQLLAEAGFANGFVMPFYVPTGATGLPETATAVALYLKQIGITADVRTIDVVQNQALLQKRSKDPTLEYTSLRSMPLANFGDPATAISFSLGPASPTSLYKSSHADFGGLIEEATSTFDEARRAAIVQKALREVYDDVGIVSLWDNVQVIAMRPGLSFTPIQHWLLMTHLTDVTRQ